MLSSYVSETLNSHRHHTWGATVEAGKWGHTGRLHPCALTAGSRCPVHPWDLQEAREATRTAHRGQTDKESVPRVPHIGPWSQHILRSKLEGREPCADTYCVLGPQLNAELALRVLCYLIGGGESNVFSIGFVESFPYNFFF